MFESTLQYLPLCLDKDLPTYVQDKTVLKRKNEEISEVSEPVSHKLMMVLIYCTCIVYLQLDFFSSTNTAT